MSASLLLLAALAASATDAPTFKGDDPKVCDMCERWNAEQAPFRLYGNTWYVGTQGLSAVLVTGKDGHVLLDGGLPQSAARIAANIETLGFKLSDVRWVLNSHAHYDHAGGIAALARASGAQVGAGAAGVGALEAGRADAEDPQAGFGDSTRFPRVPKVQGLPHGSMLKVGDVVVVAHATPGHTPGSTSWSWRSCEGDRCLDVVYVDSLNPVSAPGFRFSDEPQRVAAYRTSIATVAGLPCDVLVSVHPDVTQVLERLARRNKDAPADAFVDAAACRTYAAAATRLLDERLKRESEEPAQ